MTEVPVLVAERTHLSIFEPSGDAVEMEGVVALAPTKNAIFRRTLRGLALDAGIHRVVPTNSTIIHRNVPRPKGHSIPFLHLENLLARTTPRGVQSGRTGRINLRCLHLSILNL